MLGSFLEGLELELDLEPALELVTTGGAGGAGANKFLSFSFFLFFFFPHQQVVCRRRLSPWPLPNTRHPSQDARCKWQSIWDISRTDLIYPTKYRRVGMDLFTNVALHDDEKKMKI